MQGEEQQDDENIFRTEALQSRSSSEPLDTPINLIPYSHWLFLSGVFLVILSGFLWSILGFIPYKVEGDCILLKNTGIIKITANAKGKVTDFSVQPGDEVFAGQVIARLEQDDLRNQIFLLRKAEDELISKNAKIKDMYYTLYQNLNNLHLELESLYQSEKNLLAKGIVSKPLVIETEEKVKDLVFTLQQIFIELLNAENALAENQRNLALLQEKYEHNSKVITPYNGRVIDIAVQKGENIDEYKPIAFIEPELGNSQILQAYIYLSAEDGKKVSPGMATNIELSITKPLEYGTLLATITNVSPYPITEMGVMQKIQNSKIVDKFFKKGVVFEAIAELKPSQTSFSGYQWTSGSGPMIKLQSGTFCKARIRTKSKHPIQLLIPGNVF